MISFSQIAGDAASRNSTLSYVIHQFVYNENKDVSTSELTNANCALEAPVQLAFRLCMANVLISACQKISDSGKKPFARKAFPCLIHSVEVFQLLSSYVEILIALSFVKGVFVYYFSPPACFLEVRSNIAGDSAVRD